jgi:hypothetical protein
MFAKSRSEKDAEFVRLERAMRVSGLDDKEIDNYFSDMMTEKEMRPYIEGARQQGYRKGFDASAKESYELVLAKYENGKANITEFNEARDSFLESESNLARARYEFLFSAKLLDFYRGQKLIF